MSYEAHEYARLFPMATDAELHDMAEDIKKRGLLVPIVLLGGKILDGRNRARACEMAGIEPLFTEYQGDDPLADVVSWNLHRRQLSTSQRAALGAELRPMFEEQARERMVAGKTADPMANLPQGTSRDQAAKAVGVGGRTVQDAELIRRNSPEVFAEVKAGKKTVHAAKAEIKERQQPKKPPAPHGRYGDWRRLWDISEDVKKELEEIEMLRMDVQHKGAAGELCDQLADGFHKAARKLER